MKSNLHAELILIFLICCGELCFCVLEFDVDLFKTANHLRNKRQSLPTGSDVGYKKAWVEPCFITYSSNGTKPSAPSFELAATPAVDDSVVEKAAKLVQSLVRFVRRDVLRILTAISFGIFSSNELLTTAFPQYEVPVNCKDTCDGNCSSLCYNGVPRSNSPAYPGPRVVVVDSNIDCRETDLERGNMNLLVKMFAESLYTYIMPKEVLDDLNRNYNMVKSRWNIEPDTPLTYWTEAVVTFFNARSSLGAMNVCGDGLQCTSEYENRKNIREKDPNLSAFLVSVFNYDRSYLLHGINTC